MKIKEYFWLFAGEDINILKRCSQKRQTIFAAIGGLVAFIFLACFFSSYYAFTKLFNTYLVGLFFGAFMAWVFTNMYLLVLYTLTKNVLPHQASISTAVFSKLIRGGFICVIALLMSKPIELFVYSSRLEEDISIYKTGLVKDYERLVEEEFSVEKAKLNKEIEEQARLFGANGNRNIESLTNDLSILQIQEESKKATLREKVAITNYFIQRISILHDKYPVTWLITFFCVLMFLLPSILKHYVSINTNYYLLKRKIEVGLVEDEYKKFKSLYRNIFQFKFGENYTLQEDYIDPPFNTQKKKDLRTFKKESDLLSELYNA